MSNESEKKKFCAACGSEMADDASFCSKCGNSTKGQAQQQQAQPSVANNNYNTANVNSNMVNIPDEYKPITMWGYFGYQILFSIPCVGFILLLVFSLGGTQNKNLKNFARSYFCFMILIVIIMLIIISVAGVGAGIYSILDY